jgi:hypothetical protein
MALEAPQLRYARTDEAAGDQEDALERALGLAREVEDLLEQVPSSPAGLPGERAHSTRIAHAMAASLVDELEAVRDNLRGTRWRKTNGTA